jgi:hypothetical protein
VKSTGICSRFPGDPTNLLPSVAQLWENFKEATRELEGLIKEVLDQKAALADAADALSQQLKYLEQIVEAAVKGSLPTINPDGSVTIPVAPPGTPGSPAVNVDPGRGKVNVSVGGMCIGFGC